jgi:quercetin dioxygenase-like cupin family protein
LFRLRKKVLLTLVLAATLITTAAGQNPVSRRVLVAPGDLKWEKNSTQSGPLTAILFGDPARPGPYVIRVRFPPNILNAPHSHPDDRFVTILSGTAYLGQGNQPDRDKTTRLEPGTFFVQPAKVVHYEFTGPQEVILQVSGVGPTSADFVK